MDRVFYIIMNYHPKSWIFSYKMKWVATKREKQEKLRGEMQGQRDKNRGGKVKPGLNPGWMLS